MSEKFSKKNIIILTLFILFGFFGFFCGWFAANLIPLKLNSTQDLNTQEEKQTYGITTRKPSSQISKIQLHNVRFRWTRSIFIETKYLETTAIPYQKNSPLLLDDPNSFYLYVYNGKASLNYSTLEEIFNTKVLGYKGAPLRNIRLQTVKLADGEGIQLRGEMRLGIWLKFTMNCKIQVKDQKILLVPVSIKTLGIPFIKGALDLSRIRLEWLIHIQPGRGLEIQNSIIYINPFLLFESPSIQGNLHSAFIENDRFFVEFKNKNQLISPFQKNFFKKKLPSNTIHLWDGNVKFGRLTMENAKILMKDKNPRDIFDFYLRYYQRSLSAGVAKILPDGSIEVTMPDFFE